jgi:hypothetical protein
MSWQTSCTCAEVAAVRLQKQRERLHRLVIAALDHEHATPLVEIGEHRHVVLPAPRAGLIDPDPLHPFEVLRIDRQIDVVMHDPPDPHVVLADQAGQCRDRHLADHRHHQRLEQQREPRPRPRPRHRDQPHLVLGALHPRHPRGQERLVLKEVKMPPRLLLGVVRTFSNPPRSHSGQQNRRPFAKSTRRSSRFASGSNSTLITCHGSRSTRARPGTDRRSWACIDGSHHRRSEAGQAISRIGRYPPSTILRLSLS